MSSLSQASAIDAGFSGVAAAIQALHEAALAQPVDAVRFARLERSVSFRLECYAYLLASQDVIAQRATYAPK